MIVVDRRMCCGMEEEKIKKTGQTKGIKYTLVATIGRCRYCTRHNSKNAGGWHLQCV